jgi:hypothetical protein
MLVTRPVPEPPFATIKLKRRGSKNCAVTSSAASTVTRHAPVPVQGPDHPANLPVSAVATSVSDVPDTKSAEHEVPQSMSGGKVLRTRPVASPDLITVSRNDGGRLKVALTVLVPSIVTRQVSPVPRQSPLQPANTTSPSATAQTGVPVGAA